MPLARMPSRLAWAVFNLLQLAFTLAFTAGGIVYALASLAITRDADRLLRMGGWMWAPVLFAVRAPPSSWKGASGWIGPRTICS